MFGIADEIESSFLRQSSEALHFSTEFSEFVDYFHEEWIKRVKPINFSVFLCDTRTTAEAFNGKSNKTFKTHGNKTFKTHGKENSTRNAQNSLKNIR